MLHWPLRQQERSTSYDDVKSVIEAAFWEGKTIALDYVIPFHSVVVQSLLNMNPKAVERLYMVTSSVMADRPSATLGEVVSNKLNPLLLNLSLTKLRDVLELLFYLKEYLVSMFGVALVNVFCSDGQDVIMILYQNYLVCNVCDKTEGSMYQCAECNISTVCKTCCATEAGQAYLQLHERKCDFFQQLIHPVIQNMHFVHLCRGCMSVLHKHVKSNHFQPKPGASAACTLKKCTRRLCTACIKQRSTKKIK